VAEKILVVDDERPIRELVDLILARAGYEAIKASNGREAIDVAAKENPQLIILDMMMPGLHGIDTCRELRSRQETRGIPILVLTGYTEHEREALDAGVDDLMTKPFRPEELIARAKALLKVRHVGDEVKRALAYSQELREILPNAS
jgi:DNA-binding response OmpR family regulator